MPKYRYTSSQRIVYTAIGLLAEPGETYELPAPLDHNFELVEDEPQLELKLNDKASNKGAPSPKGA